LFVESAMTLREPGDACVHHFRDSGATAAKGTLKITNGMGQSV
jgi:hypothetical protein